MTWFKKHYLELIIVSVLATIGLFLGLKGISTNHSFWADEALVSSFSRDIILGKINFWDAINIFHYQRFQVATVALAFKLFGVSEWAARFPSVLWGSVGIIFAYLVARKYSNRWGGYLAAFLYTFLQLNLANATQAKPYSAIETLLLMTIFCSDINITLAFGLAVIASLYNYIGVIAFFH